MIYCLSSNIGECNSNRGAKVANTESINIIEPINENTCAHHWIIGDPDGPTSSGKCKLCGTQRDFMNYFEGSSWGSDVSLDQLGKSTGATREASYGQTVPSITDEDGE